jgi:hypothetical protein
MHATARDGPWQLPTHIRRPRAGRPFQIADVHTSSSPAVSRDSYRLVEQRRYSNADICDGHVRSRYRPRQEVRWASGSSRTQTSG